MRLAVFGLGKLGAPLAAVLATRGFEVNGYDPNPNAWRNLPPEPHLEDLVEAAKSRITICERPEDAVMGVAVVFVIVPTPSLPDGSFTNEHVIAALHSMRGGLSPECVVNIVSTVMPGSCDGPIREALPKGQPLTYSPEFIALGTVVRDLLNPDFIQIGESDKRSGDVVESILAQVANGNPPVHRMSLISAELAKIMNNAFICVKIGFANMLAEICDAMSGANAAQVAAAIGADHRIGIACLKPGLGFGGPCLPRDTKAVATLANSLAVNPALVKAADEGNFESAAKVMDQVMAHTGPGERVAILGQSYKPGTPVTEASQALWLAEWLAKSGRRVATYDPMAPCTAQSMEEAIKDAACVIIATPWPEFKRLKTDAPMIDPWGLLVTESV